MNKEYDQVGTLKKIIGYGSIVLLVIFAYAALITGLLFSYLVKDLPNEIKHCNPDTSMYCPEGR